MGNKQKGHSYAVSQFVIIYKFYCYLVVIIILIYNCMYLYIFRQLMVKEDFELLGYEKEK